VTSSACPGGNRQSQTSQPERRLGARLSRAPRTVGNPGHGHPDSGEIVFLCIASAHVNLLFCRSEYGICWGRRLAHKHQSHALARGAG
jgi:hypothetical protein